MRGGRGTTGIRNAAGCREESNMIERIDDVPAGIDALRAVGKITKEDYDAVVIPLIDGAARNGRLLRCLCEVGPDFQGLTPSAAWEDLKIGLRALRMIEACAVVSDIGWVRESSNLAAFFMPCPVRVFTLQDRGKAIAWLSSLPEGAGMSARLISESGIVVVELTVPLRVQDFETLAHTVDDWLETHDALQGLVIHALAIPGWENIGSLLRHVRFVRDHHRRISRVALAVDGKLASLAPRAAEHFVRADVRNFGYDELEDAIRWAAASPG
jgi:hypothetical protein